MSESPFDVNAKYAPQAVAEEHLEVLAEDPKNLVYKYVDVKPEESSRVKLPVYTLVSIVQGIHEEYEKIIRERYGVENASEIRTLSKPEQKGIRRLILRSDEKYRDFSRSHSTCWENLTKPDPSGRVYTNILRMVRLIGFKDMGKLGNTDQANSYVQQMFIRECTTEKKT